jgi:hypothetical protein
VEDNSRQIQGGEFIKIVKKYYEPIFGPIDIYIITQKADDLKFNIGKLKNIGFIEACKRKQYNNIVFTDIDMIANIELLPLLCRVPKTIMSLAYQGTRYVLPGDKSIKPFLGGMINISVENFKKINGYPNNFFGWGGEDDSLILRVHDALGNVIEIPKNGSVADLEPYISVKDKVTDLKQKQQKETNVTEKITSDFEHWKQNGLNSIKYTVLGQYSVESFTEIIVDISDVSSDPAIVGFSEAEYETKAHEIKIRLRNNVYSKMQYESI